jgi:hypothetical protein
MRIETKPIADLMPAPWNPRKITDEAMHGLQKSIDRFGLVEPVVWNEQTGHVVGGHQRLAALKARGETAVSVVVVDLPESEEKALNVTLNNQAIAGEFDDSLGDLLEEIICDIGDDAFSNLRLDLISFDNEGEPGKRAESESLVGDSGDDVSVRLVFTGDQWISARGNVLKLAREIEGRYGCKLKIDE